MLLPAHFEYLLILLTVLGITGFIHFYFELKLFKSTKQAILLFGLFYLIGITWDTFAITRGHWLFPLEKHLGLVLGVMPIEEYLFILIVPYSVIVLFTLIKEKTK